MHGLTKESVYLFAPVGLIPFIKVVDNFDAQYDYITNEGSVFTLMTNLNAPRYKLINIDFSKPEPEHWTTLVPEQAEDVLQFACCFNTDKLILVYMHDVKVRSVTCFVSFRRQQKHII